MQITCNYRGGFGLHHGLRLRHGPNKVDRELWEENQRTLNPVWLEELLAQPGDRPPHLVIAGEVAPGPRPMTASAKVALVKKCDSLDELDKLGVNETRATVSAAIDKRAKELAEAQG